MNSTCLENSPLVTICLLTYNQECFIEEAVASVLSQTYSPLEIVLSDDCSADSTFEIMRKIVDNYDGPHRIYLNRNPVNLGLVGHCNKAYNMGNGELVVVTAGDDVCLPHRVEVLVNAWMKDRSAHAIFSSFDRITKKNIRSEGRKFDALAFDTVTPEALIGILPCYPGATGAYSRQIISFSEITNTKASEDIVLPFRAALFGRILLVPDVLVLYRVDGVSSFNKKSLSPLAYREWKSKILAWTMASLEVIQQDIFLYSEHLPEGKSQRLILGVQSRHAWLSDRWVMLTGKFKDRVRASKRILSGAGLKSIIRDGDKLDGIIFLLPKWFADVLRILLMCGCGAHRQITRMSR